jgi:hypothetical protein
MSRMFESFEFMNRGWDVRALENVSLRKVFLLVLVMLFVLGMNAAVITFRVVRLHSVDPWNLIWFLGYLFFTLRYALLIYRRLES